jgi:hypothetical protein
VAGIFIRRNTGSMMIHSRIAIGLAALVGGCSILAANTALSSIASVSLLWDASTSPGIIGYNLYYGTASHVYTSEVPLNDVTNASLNSLSVGTTYYFAVTAVDSLGLESTYSNEQVFTVASGTPVVQIGIVNGKITLTGFASVGATYNVMASQDLKSWSVIGSVTGATNGAIRYTDPTGHSLPSRYYLLKAN